MRVGFSQCVNISTVSCTHVCEYLDGGECVISEMEMCKINNNYVYHRYRIAPNFRGKKLS